MKKNIKKELTKGRKFKNATPGQNRDFETLDANRMFKAYEQPDYHSRGPWQGMSDQEKKAKAKSQFDAILKKKLGNPKNYESPIKTKEEVEMEDAPTTSTAGVANWNPVLGGKRPRVVYKKRRSVDGRTKDYKETVTRLQARRDATAARELEQKLNMFGVQSNPFREEKQMENKKYLKTKEGSIEDAVLQSVRTETPFNPNDARPTLHLPEKKYLDSKDGSLEKAVTEVMVSETISGNMMRDVRMLDGDQFQIKYGMSKAHAARAGSGIQKYGRKGQGPGADPSHIAARRASRAVESHEEVEDAFDYKAKKGAIAAPGSGSIAKAKKAKSSDVNKSIEQQMADARKEEVEVDEGSLKAVGPSLPKKVEREASRKQIAGRSGRKYGGWMGATSAGPKSLAVGDKRSAHDAIRGIKKVRGTKEEVEIDEAKPTSKQVKMAKGIAWDKRHRGGDMTGAWKKAEKIKKGLGDHPTVQKALRRANEETDPNDDRGVGSKGYTEYVRNLTPGETAVKDPDAEKASSASKQASAEKKRQVTKIDDAVDPEVAAARATYKKGNQDMKKQHILDVAKIKASKVGEEVIVGLLDMGIIQVNENTETGFEVINDPVANRENLLRMAYNTGAEILDELNQKQMPTKKIPDKLKPKSLIPPNKPIPEKGPKQGQLEAINKGKISSDAYDHATALYKDQWKDRKIADYDKEHGRGSRAKEMRKDAEVDRKRMWAMTGDKWKHAKGSSGEVKGKKSEVGNPDPKDAYKKEAFSGTPNTTHDPKMGQSVAKSPLKDKETDVKEPKAASTKSLQAKQRKTAPPGSTSEDYHERLMDEAGKWIQKAIKRPGALHRDLGVPEDEKIPKSKIKAAAKEGGKVGQRARLAITLGKMNK